MKATSIVAAFFALGLMALAQAADPDLAVAGRGRTIEQALSQPHSPNYRLLILRNELLRVRASRTEQELRELIEHARGDGALVFVCEKDLRRQRVARGDLLPGILTVDASDVWVDGTPSQADEKLRSYCS